jgi:hypothetical protein
VTRARLADLAFGLGCLGVAAVTWWEAGRLPPPLFDPLGPGAVPRLVSGVLATLALLLVGRVALGLRVGHARQSMLVGVGPGGEALGYQQRPGLAVASFALAVLYVVAMQRGWVGFLAATLLFLAVLGALMTERTRRAQAVSLGVAIVTALLLDYVFRTLLVVDLP